MSLTCSGCGQRFRSMGGFDGHRFGEYTNEHPDYGRHCCTEDELREMGWRRTDGVWRMPASESDWLDRIKLSG